MATAKALFQSTLAGPHDNSKNETLRYNGGAASHQTGEGSKGQIHQRKRACFGGKDPVRGQVSKVL